MHQKVFRYNKLEFGAYTFFLTSFGFDFSNLKQRYVNDTTEIRKQRYKQTTDFASNSNFYTMETMHENYIDNNYLIKVLDLYNTLNVKRKRLNYVNYG